MRPHEAPDLPGDPLVGRARVRAELRRAVDGAGSRGRVLLLVGEAGIGKTAVAEWAAGYARARGAAVAWGWGWPAEGAPGYWPWVQVLRALGRPLPVADASDAAPPAAARIRDAIVRIDRVHPDLAAHLRASISTGTACVYAPSTPVSWRL